MHERNVRDGMVQPRVAEIVCGDVAHGRIPPRTVFQHRLEWNGSFQVLEFGTGPENGALRPVLVYPAAATWPVVVGFERASYDQRIMAELVIEENELNRESTLRPDSCVGRENWGTATLEVTPDTARLGETVRVFLNVTLSGAGCVLLPYPPSLRAEDSAGASASIRPPVACESRGLSVLVRNMVDVYEASLVYGWDGSVDGCEAKSGKVAEGFTTIRSPTGSTATIEWRR